jgi:hypothetical protein
MIVEASLGKKSVRHHLNQWLHVVLCACHPSYTGNANRRTEVQASRGKKKTLAPKQLEQKGLGAWLKW